MNSGAFSKIFLCLVLAGVFLLLTASIHADVSVTIVNNVLSANRGDVVTIQGTIQNNGTSAVYINGDSTAASQGGAEITASTYELFIDDSPFAKGAPVILAPGGQWTGNLCQITVGIDSPTGPYFLNFLVTGGSDAIQLNTLGSGSLQITVTGSAPTGAPTAPSNLAATLSPNNQVNLAWTDSAGDCDSYVIERSSDGGANWDQLATTSSNIVAYTDSSAPSGGAYLYRIRAHNSYQGGSYSTPSNFFTVIMPTPTVAGTGDGLLGTYYNDGASHYAGTPVLVRVDPTVDFIFSGATSPGGGVGGSNGTNFSVRWTGLIIPPYPGTYTFYTDTDDGTALFIDGVQLISDPTAHSQTLEQMGTVQLVAGQVYTIEMDYFQYGGNAEAHLFWSSPSTPKEIVPQSCLFSCSVGSAPSGLTAVPGSGSQINLNWTGSASNAASYLIQRKLGSAGDYASIAIVPGNVFQFVDSPPVAGANYYYRVQTVNFGNSSAYSYALVASSFLGMPVAIDSPANTGGAATTYSISPGLPPGLTLDPATGIISGTPTSITPAATYTITASNSGGTATTVLTFAVDDVPPGNLTYSANPASYLRGVTITPNTPSNTRGTVVSYAVSPTLPPGLSLDTSTGVISGAPLTGWPKSTYTITATNSGGSTSATLEINVVGPYALSAYSLVEGPAAGSDSVILTAAPAGGPWTATANDDWLHMSAGSQQGTGSALILLSFDLNTGGTRTGGISIGDQVLSVTQAGATYMAAGVVTPLVSTGLNTPWGVAVDGSGNVYIADTNNNAIKMWDPMTQTVRPIVSSGLSFPQAVAVDGAGNLYIVQADNAAIVMWSAATQTTSTLLDARSGLGQPMSVAVDSTGNLYFTDAADDTVKKWNVSTGLVSTLVSSGLQQPRGLAVDAAGNLYIADANAIDLWNAATQTLSPLISTGLNAPMGVAVDGSGNVYVADTYNNAIEKWNAASGTMTSLVSTGLYYPRGVAVDVAGDVYLADTYESTIAELPRTFVDPTPRTEGGATLSDALPPVLPATTNLLFPFAPTSDQTWLTSGPTITGGMVNFSLTANYGTASRTAHLLLLGQSIFVVQAPAPPSSLTYSAVSALYEVGIPIVVNTPTSTEGTVVSYSISPGLPPGLTLDPVTGIISGIPTGITATATYSITASNSGGTATTILTLTVDDVPPGNLTYSTNPASYSGGVPITPNTPSNTGGTVVSYSVSPTLPLGLSLDTSTGMISGTPLTGWPQTTYTITATNTGGATTTTLQISVAQPVPAMPLWGWLVLPLAIFLIAARSLSKVRE